MKLIIAFLAAGLVTFSSIAGTDLKVKSTDSKVGWLAKKVTGQHNGTVNLKSGTLSIDKNKLTGGTFVIDMTSIVVEDIENEEDNAKLKGHLHSADFFNTSEFGEASFAITSAKKKKSDEGNYEITGNLTIKGITNAVTFPANVSVSGDNATATATIVFDRAKFDVRYGSGSFFDNLGDKTIYDDVEMKINLVAGN